MRFLYIFIVSIGILNAQEMVSSITSDFKQIITSPEKDTLQYSGSFQALSENMNNFALWNYKTPIKKRIYFTNNEVVIVEPDLEQVVITSIRDTQDISSILNEAIKTNKQTNKNVTVTIDGINYDIYFDNGVPVKISYTDKLDNKIEILLKNTTINMKIDKLTFKADIPKGFDVVRY